MPMPVAAIIVAAGGSSRLGQPKQLVKVDGEPLLQRAIRCAGAAGASPIVVVLGAQRELIRSAINLGTASIVVNEDWEEGLASSIRAGVKAAAGAAGFLLMTCDQPRVTAEHLRQIIERFESQREPTLIASSYVGIRGVPAIFPSEAAGHLLGLRGDRGARALLQESSWPVLSIPLEGGEVDIDRPDDLAKIC
jgi:CTP:molybdopterin cytidylyltransferase MocA